MIRFRDHGGALAITAFVWCSLSAGLGCAQVLGIDGDYVRVTDNGASKSGAGGIAQSPSSESGGAFFGSGGVAPGETGGADTGGVAGGSGGGANRDAGPVSTGGAPSIPAACQAGSYEGTLTGTHTPSAFAVIPVPPQPVSVTGTVSFKLNPDATGTRATVDGVMTGNVDLTVIGMTGITFNGTLKASVECATGEMTGTIDGSYGLSPADVKFSGTHAGTFVNGKFSGNWSETETMNAAYGGSGDWDAARTGP